MYYIIAASIIIISAAIAVSHFFENKRSAKIVKTASIVLAALGAVMLIYSVSAFLVKLGKSGIEADSAAWARDMFFLYFKWAAVFTAAVGAVSLLSSLLKSKFSKLRIAVCFFGTVIVLLTCLLYSLTAEGSGTNPSGYIRLSGISLSLLFPAFELPVQRKGRRNNNVK